ncbi:MAG: hypothetical protein AB3N23_09955 [Paracoccaceae bacterium]
MGKYRKYIVYGGTLACALGVGFFMQYGRDVPQAQAPSLEPVAIKTQPIEARPVAEPETEVAVAQPVAEEAIEPAVAEATPADPNFVAEPDTVVTRNDRPRLDAVSLAATQPVATLPRALPDTPQPVAFTGTETDLTAPADPQTPQLGCELKAHAVEAEAAMARVTIDATCYPNERVTVHHNGMMFTDVTDANGALELDVPVLTENAVFILAFSNGKGAVAQTKVPSLANYDRVALQWSGLGGFQIHAREYGAGYGDQGHVWSGSPRSSAEAMQGAGGFVTRLGDANTLAPQLVEVYTFPTVTADQSGTVTMSIETEVTENNCGRDVSAQVLRIGPDQTASTRNLVLSVPDCDAIGDFLVLNNLVDDLKIAGK